jgi:photosystem II stability/assembly factor-like uncharacterized protein
MLRRHALAVAALAALGRARAAPYAVDGPARQRPGASRSALLDVALAGVRLVAVGERGHVLLSDDAGTTWRQAKAVPTRTTLTCVHATDAQTLWAAGHGGVILRTADGGEQWTLAHGQADGPDVLLALRVEPDGRGLAVGGFGAALATSDAGKTWQTRTLVEGEMGERHLNRLFVSSAGTWLVAAEGGHVLRSTDRGATWAAIKTPYAGSLWSGLELPGGVLLAGGMRGNIVRSSDDGATWKHLPVPGAGSLTGATLTAEGADARPLFVGVDGTVVLGDAAGEQFRLQRLDDRATLTAVVRASGGGVVAASAGGMRRIEPMR